jgi:hypothetical protein
MEEVVIQQEGNNPPPHLPRESRYLSITGCCLAELGEKCGQIWKIKRTIN